MHSVYITLRCIMARLVNKLTAKEVQQAKPKAKAYRLSDGGGLSLYITPTDAKNWHFRYIRPTSKKPTYLGLGAYPTVTLAEARDKRDNYKKMLSAGLDPQIEMEKAKAEELAKQKNTFQDIALQYLELEKHRIAENTYIKKEGKLVKHVFPYIGSLPISELTAPYVISKMKHLEAEGKIHTLHKTINIINNIMTYGLNIGVIDQNPLFGIGKAFKGERGENRATLPPEQLPLLLSTMMHASITRPTKCLFEFQLHTMVRPSEAVTARWEEINLEEKLWIIPAEKMKMRKEHLVPLTPQVIAILEYMQQLSTGNGYVFPSTSSKSGHIANETLIRAISRTALKGQQTAHGLRALASTTLNEKGFDPDVIEKALAHGDRNRIRAVYNRAQYLEPRKKMLCWWSDHISACAQGNMSMSALANVVNLR